MFTTLDSFVKNVWVLKIGLEGKNPQTVTHEVSFLFFFPPSLKKGKKKKALLLATRGFFQYGFQLKRLSAVIQHA
jgi:hypothetical protein